MIDPEEFLQTIFTEVHPNMLDNYIESVFKLDNMNTFTEAMQSFSEILDVLSEISGKCPRKVEYSIVESVYFKFKDLTLVSNRINYDVLKDFLNKINAIYKVQYPALWILIQNSKFMVNDIQTNLAFLLEVSLFNFTTSVNVYNLSKFSIDFSRLINIITEYNSFYPMSLILDLLSQDLIPSKYFKHIYSRIQVSSVVAFSLGDWIAYNRPKFFLHAARFMNEHAINFILGKYKNFTYFDELVKMYCLLNPLIVKYNPKYLIFLSPKIFDIVVSKNGINTMTRIIREYYNQSIEEFREKLVQSEIFLNL